MSVAATLEVGQRVVLSGLPGLTGGLMKTVGAVVLVGPTESILWLPDMRRHWPIRAQDMRHGDLAVVPAGVWPPSGADQIFDSLFRVEAP